MRFKIRVGAVTDIISDIHDFDFGAFASPEEALAALAGLADEAADEIERHRRLLRVALDARLEDEAPSDGWYDSAREALGDE
jgi:hypothetical protein